MNAVLDSSAAVLLLLDPQKQSIRRQLSGFSGLRAPMHFDIEVLAALRRCWLRDDLSRQQFEQLARISPNLPVRRINTKELTRRIIELAANVTPHDAAYVALAEATEAPLITADLRLAAASGIRCEVIRVP